MPRAHSIEEILQRQANFWEVRRRLGEEGGPAARRMLAHLSEGPWVSVSKELGSGGVTLARGVAEHLGWQVFDREILSAISRQTDQREAILSRLDENSLGAFDDYISQLLVGSLGQTAFLQETARVLWGIGRQGNAVILGRGANWLLRPEFGLRVRTVAPVETRVQVVSRLARLSAEQARQRIEEADAQQRSFVRKSFHQEIDDPLGYDLVLNTEGLNDDAARGVVIAALEAKLGGPTTRE